MDSDKSKRTGFTFYKDGVYYSSETTNQSLNTEPYFGVDKLKEKIKLRINPYLELKPEGLLSKTSNRIINNS